jgi:hypothetical protein
MYLLLNAISTRTRNTQAYSMGALLACVALYPSGRAKLVEKDAQGEFGMLVHVWTLLQSKVITVVRNVLDILLSVLFYSEGCEGFQILNQVAKKVAADEIYKSGVINARRPYQEFAEQFGLEKCFQTQEKVLLLVNQMADKAGTERRRTKFFDKLDAIGYNDAIEKIGAVDDDDIKTQMATYQRNRGIILPKTFFEVETLRVKLQKLQQSYQSAENKAKMYEQQQAQVKLLQQEIIRCRHTLKNAAVWNFVMNHRAPEKVCSLSADVAGLCGWFQCQSLQRMGSDARLAPNETAESVCNETYALSLPLLDNKQPGALPESVASRSVGVCASNKPQQSAKPVCTVCVDGPSGVRACATGGRHHTAAEGQDRGDLCARRCRRTEAGEPTARSACVRAVRWAARVRAVRSHWRMR